MSRISSLEILPRLLSLAAAQTASLFNVSGLAAPFQVSRPTIRDYVTLLERVFLVDLLAPWHSNRLSRLVKTPKLHVNDSGLAAALLGLDRDAIVADRGTLGPLLETFVYQEMARQASWSEEPVGFFHFRDRDGVEVDIVLERGARAVGGIEVKASSTVTEADFRGLRKLQQASGKRFARGVVLYDGEAVLPFGDRLDAVPIRLLWDAT
jgi:predicted AAA+ superfamily ATPase